MLQKLKATVISKVLRGFYHLSLEPGYKMHGLNKIRGLCIKLACTGFVVLLPATMTMEEVREALGPCQAKVTLVPRDPRFLVTWCLKTESPNRVRMRVLCRAFE